MADSKRVTVEVEAGEGAYSVSAGGARNLAKVRAMEYTADYVAIDGIGPRGGTVPGLRIAPEAMDMLAIRWLEARGQKGD
jgi:hypothetical protein